MELTYYDFLPDELMEVPVEGKNYFDMISENDFLNKHTDALANENFRVFEKMDWKNELQDKIKIASRSQGGGYANAYIVEYKGEFVGAVMISYTQEVATIEYILTFKEHRGKGIAEKIMRDILTDPKEFGVEADIEKFQGYVAIKNIASKRLVEKLGFEVAEIIGGDTIRFEKPAKEKESDEFDL